MSPEPESNMWYQLRRSTFVEVGPCMSGGSVGVIRSGSRARSAHCRIRRAPAAGEASACTVTEVNLIFTATDGRPKVYGKRCLARCRRGGEGARCGGIRHTSRSQLASVPAISASDERLVRTAEWRHVLADNSTGRVLPDDDARARLCTAEVIGNGEGRAVGACSRVEVGERSGCLERGRRQCLRMC